MSDYIATLPTRGHDLVPERLPNIFRLSAFQHRPLTDKMHECTATLFHDQSTLRVTWMVGQPDTRLHVGSLVAIRWFGCPVSQEGVMRIARLVLIEKPEASINLFDCTPTAWVADRELVKRGNALLDRLPRNFSHLFNAIFWDDRRFHRYLIGPSSMAGHHNRPNGNLRHSIEVAETALVLADEYRMAFAPVLILAALLHDAGKADEYSYAGGDRFSMSPRGVLIGHRLTMVEWIAAAMAKHRVILPEAHYLSLMHALTAVQGAPDWMGMRAPQSLEASILSMADRLSGQSDLVERFAPKAEGFGQYHKHLRGRPYVVGEGRATILS